MQESVAVILVGLPLSTETMAARMVSPAAIAVVVKSLVDVDTSNVPVVNAKPLVLIEFADVGTAVPDAIFQKPICTVPVSTVIATEKLPAPIVQATGLVRNERGSELVVSVAPPS